MTGEKFNYNGNEIYYEKHGTGPQAILMMPGGTGSIDTDMRPLISAMSQNKYTIIAMDPLGYGKSRPPARDYAKGVNLYKMDAVAGVELMKSLGYPSFSWIGWSDGGRVGLVAAINFTSRIDKLVIWGSAARVTARQQLALEGARDLGIWDPVRRQAFCDEYGGLQEATHVWGLHVDYYKTLGNICEEDVGKIRCPTLLLHGERDPIEKTLVQELEKQISDSEFHVFPNAGHATHIEAKKDFVKIMERFLDQDM